MTKKGRHFFRKKDRGDTISLPPWVTPNLVTPQNIHAVVADCCPGFSIDALPVPQQQHVEPYQDSFDQLGAHLHVSVFTGSCL